MAAVLAAIGAAFLAGIIALFREHRLQQRRLLVAARTMFGTLLLSEIALKTCLSSDEWQPLNLVPDETSFGKTWDESRGDLAGHLTWPEWRAIETAIGQYLVLKEKTQADPPSQSKELIDSVIASLARGGEQLKPYAERRLSLGRFGKRKASELWRGQRRAGAKFSSP